MPRIDYLNKNNKRMMGGGNVKQGIPPTGGHVNMMKIGMAPMPPNRAYAGVTLQNYGYNTQEILLYNYTKSITFEADGDLTSYPFYTSNTNSEYKVASHVGDAYVINFNYNDGLLDGDGLSFNALTAADKLKIRKITSFGQIPLSKTGSQFIDISLEIEASDTPWIRSGTSFNSAFKDTSLNIAGGGTFDWNIVNVGSMESMFEGATFNENLNTWNMENVTSMKNMFKNTKSYLNGTTDINFNSVSVTTMEGMFNTASIYQAVGGNAGLGVILTTDKVTNMKEMFKNAALYANAGAGNIASWNVGNVTDMTSMFEEADSFNTDISGWDVGKVTDMTSMFSGNGQYKNDSITLGWNTNNVTKMTSMFQGAAFDVDICFNWSNVTDATDMFTGAAFPVAQWNNLLVNINSQSANIQTGVPIMGPAEPTGAGALAKFALGLLPAPGWIIIP